MPRANSNRSTSAFRAARIITMDPCCPEINDGLMLAQDNLLLGIGTYKELKASYSGEITDLGDTVIVPGLINAHTHLELSHLQGKTTAGQGFEAWVKSLIANPLNGIKKEEVTRQLSGLKNNGIVCIGDISGHNQRIILDALGKSEIYYRLFLEFLGFKPPKSNQIKWPKKINPSREPNIGLSGHALYSTHPGTLQMLKTWSSLNNRPFSLHLAEHSGEVELLTTGRGSFASFIKDTLIPRNFVPPGLTPVHYADQLGLLDQDTLAVHCVQVGPEDISILQDRGVNICICPRSNDFIGVGRSPWEELFQANIPLSLGTDSLCSNYDLDLWQEALFLLQHWQGELNLHDLIAFMSINPAKALKVDNHLGSLEKGKMLYFTAVPRFILDSLAAGD